MPGKLGANSDSAGYYQASGEATPQQKLPAEFVSTNRPASPIHGAVTMAPDWNGNTRRMPIVQRAQRTKGMKYLYVRGATRQPIHPLGADGVPYPWTSKFQPNLQGPIHNGGFNYALFQAGYPGFNLGLSFRVPILDRGSPQYINGPGYNMTGGGPKSNKGGSRGTNPLGRAI
jgi:hypothetical protein